MQMIQTLPFGGFPLSDAISSQFHHNFITSLADLERSTTNRSLQWLWYWSLVDPASALLLLLICCLMI